MVKCMSEALRSIVYNSVVSHAHLPRHAALSVTRIFASRTIPLPSNYFSTPEPRRWTGKAKESSKETQNRAVFWVLSQTAPFLAWPNPCQTKVSRPVREKQVRRSLKSHPPARRSSLLLRRHVSYFAPRASPSRASSETGIRHTYKNLIEYVAREPDEFDVDLALQIYAGLRKESRSRLDRNIKLRFVARCLDKLEELYTTDDAAQEYQPFESSADLFQKLLDECTDLAGLDEKEGHVTVAALQPRVFALKGKIGAAVNAMTALNSGLKHSDTTSAAHLLFDICTNILLAQAHYFGRHTTSEIATTIIHELRPYLTSEKASIAHLSKGLRTTITRTANIDVDAELSSNSQRDLQTVRSSRAEPNQEDSIRKLCVSKRSLEAYEQYVSIIRDERFVTQSTRLFLVRGLMNGRFWDQADSVFGDALTSCDDPNDQQLCTVGLTLHARQGQSKEARAYYDKLEPYAKDMFSRDILLLQAFALGAEKDEAVKFFEDIYPLGGSEKAPIQAYTLMLQAFSLANDHQGLNRWLEKMTIEGGYKPDAHVFTVIIDNFASRGHVDSVTEALQQMRSAGFKPHISTCDSILRMFAKRKDPAGAEALFKAIVEVDRIQPDEQLFDSLLLSHVNSRSWKGVVRVFDFLKHKFPSYVNNSIVVHDQILQAYVGIGAPYSVVNQVYRSFINMGLPPSNKTYVLLTQAACNSGRLDVAINHLETVQNLESQSSGLRYKVTTTILTIIMTTHLKNGNHAMAFKIFRNIKERGLRYDAMVYNGIISTCANESSQGVELARQLVNEIMVDESWMNIVGDRVAALELVYAPLLTGYAKYKPVHEGEELVQEFLDHGGEPTLNILQALLLIYAKAKHFERMKATWSQLLELGRHKYEEHEALIRAVGGTPSKNGQFRQFVCVPASIYIDALSMAGHHDQVAEVWATLDEFGFTKDAHNWNTLVSSLIRAGEVEHAFGVVERVILRFRDKVNGTFTPTRLQKPRTPYVFDDEAPRENEKANGEDDADVPPDIRNNSPEFSNMTARSGAYGDYLGRSQDAVYALHVMYQINPGWHAWRLHRFVTNLLLDVLRNLRNGYHIRPINGELTTVPAGEPQELHERLLTRFPKTIAYLQKESYRRERKSILVTTKSI